MKKLGKILVSATLLVGGIINSANAQSVDDAKKKLDEVKKYSKIKVMSNRLYHVTGAAGLSSFVIIF